jgi:N-methylhydantoinase A
VLGRINARRFLNGGMPLDVEAARRAIQEKIAGPLGLSVEEAALGIIRIADSAMSLSVRAVSVNKGVDPRDTALIAFGGGGPLHASSIAREIYIPTVIIPKLPGTFSALGMLMASWRQDLVRTLIGRLGALDAATVRWVYEELKAAGHEHLVADGIAADVARFEFYVDLRYVGQEHAIPIPITRPEDLTDGRAALKAAFDVEHQQRYSQSAPDESMEVVNVRLIVTADRADTLAERWLSEPGRAEVARQDETRKVIFDNAEKPLDARIVWRPALKPGDVIEGPAVIEEPNSTTLVPPGDIVTVADTGHMIIQIGLSH